MPEHPSAPDPWPAGPWLEPSELEPRPPGGRRRRASALVLVALVAFAGGYLTRLLWGDVLPGLSARRASPPVAAAAEPAPAAPPPTVGVDDDPWLGLAQAPVTVIEFSDYQCPFCKRFFDQTLQQLLGAYDGRIRFVYRDFPLTSLHPHAQKAAEAAQCADDQDHYWQMHDVLFARQDQWANGNAVQAFKGYATRLGLNGEEFAACLDGGKYRAEVLLDLKAGLDAGVTGTPTFFINGRKLSGAVPFIYFQAIIEDELAKRGG